MEDKGEEQSDKKELKDEEPKSDYKEEDLESNNKDNEKFEFEFPIVPLIVGGVLIIVFVFTFFAWDDIKITAGVIFGSEIAEYKKECKNQCELQDLNLQDLETYCCAPKGIYIGEENEVYTCQNDILKTNCELNCRGVCSNLCTDITQMIPCAQAGCTWIAKSYEDYGGYCRVKDGT